VKVIGVLNVAHGAVGQVDHGVHVVVAVGEHVLDDADHLVGNALDAHRLPQRVLPGKQFLLYLCTQHSYTAVREVFLVTKETAFTDFDVTDLPVTGVGSPDVVVAAARPIGHEALLVHLGRNSLAHGSFSV